MHNDIKKISLNEEQIEEIVSRLGKEISNDYNGKEPLFIGILKGCIPFMPDLLKNVSINCTLDYLRVSSYEGTKSSGKIKIKGDIPSVKDKDVIIVEDILDTGRTLMNVRNLLLEKGAKSVNICVLLDKPEGRIVDIKADYVGGHVPNEFVVGYGLDYNEKYRNLPYIGVLKEEIYTH